MRNQSASKFPDDPTPMPLTVGGVSEEAKGVQQHTPQPRFSHAIHIASLLNTSGDKAGFRVGKAGLAGADDPLKQRPSRRVATPTDSSPGFPASFEPLLPVCWCSFDLRLPSPITYGTAGIFLQVFLRKLPRKKRKVESGKRKRARNQQPGIGTKGYWSRTLKKRRSSSSISEGSATVRTTSSWTSFL